MYVPQQVIASLDLLYVLWIIYENQKTAELEEGIVLSKNSL